MKVTKDMIDGVIKETKYTLINKTMTHCQIITHCGFVFSGESACMDVCSFDGEIGKRISYENAYNKMWSHIGFHIMQVNEDLKTGVLYKM